MLEKIGGRIDHPLVESSRVHVEVEVSAFEIVSGMHIDKIKLEDSHTHHL